MPGSARPARKREREDVGSHAASPASLPKTSAAAAPGSGTLAVSSSSGASNEAYEAASPFASAGRRTQLPRRGSSPGLAGLSAGPGAGHDGAAAALPGWQGLPGGPDASREAGAPAAPAAAVQGDCSTEFATFAVGRGLFPPLAEQPLAGQPLAIRPEPGNPRDANALMVVYPNPDSTRHPDPGAGPAAGLGYLPAVVAAVRAPLLAQGLAVTDAVTAEAPASGAAPLRLTLRVRPC